MAASKMTQLRINHFWLWFLSLLFTIALVILTLPILKPLTSSLFYPESRLDGLHSSYEDRTIYNPGENVLGGPKLRGSRPNFLYEFHERHDLESLDSTADETWNNAMSTPLGGFLLVQHNETYQRGWGVSMFHSLHCLGMLRASLQSHFGLNPEGGDHGTHMHGSGRRRGEEKRFSVDERQHAEHCIGYIARVSLSYPSWTASYGQDETRAGWRPADLLFLPGTPMQWR